MKQKTAIISKPEFKRLKLKKGLAGNLLLQLNASLKAAKRGKIKKSA